MTNQYVYIKKVVQIINDFNDWATTNNIQTDQP